ncbi:MAG: RidA family protein [Pseudolabrys sp.]|jgi:enamine deaminase RidA (YjgF/YER057c/UK114 family)|nr:RidA family protein [Pseudolabrys sp.]
MDRRLISSGSPFEPRIGFSRAVRVGSHIAVSGTAPIAEGGDTACPGDLYGQTKRCLEIIEQAVIAAGGKREHIVRTRMFLKEIANWQEAGRAHGEFFANIRPAATMIQIVQAIDPDWLIEIEADAIVA